MAQQILFKITEPGQTALEAAYHEGRRLTILTFKLGSASDYTPDGSETSLRGTTVYSASVSSYVNNPDGSLTLTCTVDPAAGPFTFGEIGLFTSTGILFAVAAVPIALTKTPFDQQTNLATTCTFKLRIRYSKASTALAIVSARLPAQQYVYTWESVVDPNHMVDISIKQTVVSDVDEKGSYSSLVQTANGWSMQSNMFAFAHSPNIKGIGGDRKSLTITSAEWQKLIDGSVATTIAYAQGFSFVAQLNPAEFKKGTISVSNGDVQLQFGSALSSAVTVNSTFRLWTTDSALLKTSEESELQVKLNAARTLLGIVQNAFGQAIFRGLIVEWGQSDIPAGWAVCDGTQGTPDMRDRFIIGAGQSYSLNATGGSPNAIAVAHSHAANLAGSVASAGGHTHSYKTYPYGMGLSPQPSGQRGNANTNGDWGFVQTGSPSGTSEGAHSHTLDASGTINNAGIDGTNRNLPPYMALFYIMKL